jgi:hypothetical protein
VNCLSYTHIHVSSHQHRTCSTQIHSSPEAVKPRWNPESSSSHLYNSWHISVCVCARACLFPGACWRGSLLDNFRTAAQVLQALCC